MVLLALPPAVAASDLVAGVGGGRWLWEKLTLTLNLMVVAIGSRD